MATKRKKYRVYYHQDGGKVYSGNEFTTQWAAKAEVDTWNKKYQVTPPADGSAFVEPVDA